MKSGVELQSVRQVDGKPVVEDGVLFSPAARRLRGKAPDGEVRRKCMIALAVFFFAVSVCDTLIPPPLEGHMEFARNRFDRVAAIR